MTTLTQARFNVSKRGQELMSEIRDAMESTDDDPILGEDLARAFVAFIQAMTERATIHEMRASTRAAADEASIERRLR